MKRFLLIAGLALALCACATTGGNGQPRMSEAEQIAFGCQGAQLTVAVLDGLHAELVRELTEAQVRAVVEAKASALDICATPPETFAELKAEGYAEAVELLTRELAAYLGAKAKAKP